MIRVIGVTHHYGIRPVLKDFSIDIATGDLVTVLGPNGMGKTTLLGVMAGVLSPIRGEVEIDGVCRRSSIENEREIRRKVFYLADRPWLPINRTGRIIGLQRLFLPSYDRVLAAPLATLGVGLLAWAIRRWLQLPMLATGPVLVGLALWITLAAPPRLEAWHFTGRYRLNLRAVINGRSFERL